MKYHLKLLILSLCGIFIGGGKPEKKRGKVRDLKNSNEKKNIHMNEGAIWVET